MQLSSFGYSDDTWFYLLRIHGNQKLVLYGEQLVLDSFSLYDCSSDCHVLFTLKI